MLRHSFLLAVFAGALACGALADDEGQEPPICDGKGQSSCNKKVEDDGSSTSVSFIQSALKIEIERADSEEESAKSQEEAKTSQGDCDQASLKAWVTAAAAKAALAQNEHMEEALRERDEKIIHLQLNFLELMKVLNPKFVDKLRNHGVNGLEDPMPSWEEVQEVLLQKDGATIASSDKEKVRGVHASLKDMMLRSLVQLKTSRLEWVEGIVHGIVGPAITSVTSKVEAFATSAVKTAVKKITTPLNKVIGTVSGLVTKVGKIPSQISSAATGAIAKAKTFATDAVNAAVDAIKIPLDKVIGTVKTVATEVGAIPSKISSAAAAAIATVETFVTNAVSAVKATFNGIIEGVKSWLKKIGEVVEGFAKFVTQLYDKYLKPIISFVGECAGNAKSAPEFMFCAIQPILDKVLEVLSPNGESVPSKLTFPEDVESVVYDHNTGVSQLYQPCIDCQDDDPRDLQQSECEQHSHTFFGVVTVTGSACNIPFIPGGRGGKGARAGAALDAASMIVSKTVECRNKASLWQAGGILPKMDEAIKTTMKFAVYCEDTIPELCGKIGALLRKVSADQNVADAHKNLLNAAEDASELRTSGMEARHALADYEPSLPVDNTMAAYFFGLYSNVQACKISFIKAEQSLTTLKNSKDSAVKAFAEDAEAIMNSGRQALDTALSQVNEINDLGAGGMENSIVSAVTDALKNPPEGDVSEFMAACAVTRNSYMKLYLEVVIAGIPVMRISVHERDGFKAAHFNASSTGELTIAYQNFTWASLEHHAGQELHIGGLFVHVGFKLSIRKNPSTLFGMSSPIPYGGLGELKFLELEVTQAYYSMRALGIPVDIPMPLTLLPPITLPLPLSTLVVAEDPAPEVAEALKNVAAKRIANEREADSITKGTHTGPKDPAGAAELKNAIDNALTTLEDTCTYKSTCTSCKDSKYLHDGTCVQGCPRGYSGIGLTPTGRKCKAPVHYTLSHTGAICGEGGRVGLHKNVGLLGACKRLCTEAATCWHISWIPTLTGGWCETLSSCNRNYRYPGSQHYIYDMHLYKSTEAR